MIPYLELVQGLARWREKQGLSAHAADHLFAFGMAEHTHPSVPLHVPYDESAEVLVSADVDMSEDYEAETVVNRSIAIDYPMVSDAFRNPSPRGG